MELLWLVLVVKSYHLTDGLRHDYQRIVLIQIIDVGRHNFKDLFFLNLCV